jgi:hypothetical protein
MIAFGEFIAGIPTAMHQSRVVGAIVLTNSSPDGDVP